MTQMPVLDTCTEVTASLLKTSRRKIQTSNTTEVTSISFNQPLQKRIMQLPTLKQQHDVSLN
jgi:hypothetical protein